MPIDIKQVKMNDHWNNNLILWHRMYPFLEAQHFISEDNYKFLLMRQLKISKKGPWLAGGAARKMFFGQELDTDLDLFFADDIQYMLYESNLRDLAKKNNDVKFLGRSTYASNFQINKKKIQLINFEFYESIEKLFESFDFTICHFACDGEYFYYTDAAITDADSKQLKTVYLRSPERGMRRIIKFAQQGYDISGIEIKEFFKKIKICNHEEEQQKPYNYDITWAGDILDQQIEETCRESGITPKEIDFCSSSYARSVMITFYSPEDKNLFKLILSLHYPHVEEKRYE